MKGTRIENERTALTVQLAPQEVGFENGVDEMNLVEFPLAAISDRFPAGLKTVEFADQIFDRVENRMVNRRLTISGSDRYGLPTATDEDVLLACLQLTKLKEFLSPTVNFSRYELLRILRWSDDTRNYYRIEQSLRRWKGLVVYSDRAFYDHLEKSWVNRDFGIFDNLYIYRREVADRQLSTQASRFTWNEVLFRSFQAGYLKRLDWGLYTRLESPVAKRLYRFLDKRFYHRGAVEIDLHELANRKIRLSANYNVAQMKRALLKGIEELQSKWDLRSLPDTRQFTKRGKGVWIVRFERKAKRRPSELCPPTSSVILSTVDPSQLEYALTKRQVGPATANELSEQYPVQSVQMMIALYDWYNSRNQPRGPGFLVNAIKNPDSIAIPPGFKQSVASAVVTPKSSTESPSKSGLISKSERDALTREESRALAFSAFWQRLAPTEQSSFENQAVDHALPTKRDGYHRLQGKGGRIFQQYREIILRDHFERTNIQASIEK